jgi:hypothetical protein
MDQINADTNGVWYRLARKKVICKWHLDLSVKALLDKVEKEVLRLEEELDKNVVCHLFSSNYTANILPMKQFKDL